MLANQVSLQTCLCSWIHIHLEPWKCYSSCPIPICFPCCVPQILVSFFTSYYSWRGSIPYNFFTMLLLHWFPICPQIAVSDPSVFILLIRRISTNFSWAGPSSVLFLTEHHLMHTNPAVQPKQMLGVLWAHYGSHDSPRLCLKGSLGLSALYRYPTTFSVT